MSPGPTVGAIITILLAEGLRIGFGTKAVGWDNLVYGVLLVMFIIFLPKGILGSIMEKVKTRRKPAINAAPSPLPALRGERSETSRSEVSG
jgi:branched-chain amino acid transport system permease protein